MAKSSQIALFFVLLISNYSSAYVGAVTSATAGAGRAAIETTDSPSLNPASLAYMRGYFLTTSYSSQSSGEKSRGADFSIGVADNMRDTIVPTALIYSQERRLDNSNSELMTRDFRLSFGNFVEKNVAFGLGFHHKTDSFFEKNYSQTNMYSGLLWTVYDNMGLALVGENLLSPNKNIPEEYRLGQSTAFGFNYNYRKYVRFKVDLTTNQTNSITYPTLAAGVESYWNRWIIIRLGAQKNYETNVHQFGSGIGFGGPRFALHYAYVSSPDEAKLIRHSVDLAMPIW
ncbi:MAG: hypothetical protein BroJett040_10470 [Oligoflexia bacterium]|nr:MAG: hypothetical protein BroJett040_10470 [Oligoflexia bacterium]